MGRSQAAVRCGSAVRLGRCLAVFALLLPAVVHASTNPANLVLWNKLGSSNEVANSEVGPDGTYHGLGIFTQGMFGSAIRVGHNEDVPITFPYQAVPGGQGCIEFWGRLEGIPSGLPNGGNPTFVIIQDGSAVYGIHLNANNGRGGGGLCSWAGTHRTGTGSFGSWSYSDVLGVGQTETWHHYALAWDTNGLAGVDNGARISAVFLDGVLNSGDWLTVGSPALPAPGAGSLELLKISSNLSQGHFLMDNLKIWNCPKTDFSDRFTEAATNAPPTSNTLTNKLVLHYTFPSDSGGVVYDETGNGHTATVFDDASWSSQGLPGGSCDFDGDEDYIQTLSTSDLQITGDVTISAWINARSFAINGVSPYGNHNLVVGKNVSTYASEYDITIWSRRVYFLRGNNSSASFYLGNTVLDSNRWHHIVCVAEGTTGRTYIDGVLDATGTFTVTPTASSDPVRIGRKGSGGDGLYFDGLMDDVRIYCRALSSNEVGQLYQIGATNLPMSQPCLPVAWLRMDEASGPTAHDSIADHDGTVSGAAWEAGVLGSGLSFDGVNDSILVGDNSYHIQSNFTIVAWFRHEGPTTGAAPLVSKTHHGSFGTRGIEFYITGSEYVAYFWNSSSQFFRGRIADISDRLDGQWHQAVLQHDPSLPNHQMRLFLDGEELSVIFDYEAVASIPVIRQTTAPWQIAHWDGGPNPHFPGDLDEVAIYDKVLSASEISNLYANVRAGIAYDGSVPSNYLNVAVSGPGSLDVGDGWYTNDAQVFIQATPSNGYVFAHWQGDVPTNDLSSNPLSLAMDISRNVTAVFEEFTGLKKLVLWNKLGSSNEVANSEVGPDGTITGSLSHGPAKFGGGMTVSTGNGVRFDPLALPGYDTAATYELWMKTPAVLTNHDMIMWSHQGSGVNGLNLRLEADGGIKVQLINAPSDDLVTVATAATGLQADTWYHIALAWDFVNTIDGTDTAKFFVDGVETWSTTATKTTLHSFGPVGSHLNFSVGAEGWGGSYSSPFRGVLDNLKVWCYAKTDFSDRFTESVDVGLVLRYIFEDDQGTNVVDVSGHGNHGLIQNTSKVSTVAGLN